MLPSLEQMSSQAMLIMIPDPGKLFAESITVSRNCFQKHCLIQAVWLPLYRLQLSFILSPLWIGSGSWWRWREHREMKGGNEGLYKEGATLDGNCLRLAP